MIKQVARQLSTRTRKLSREEISHAFASGPGARFPPILTVKQLAEAMQISTKTVYEWIAKGRLDGTFRKRGKHILLWRDRVIEIIFNGSEWKE